MILMSVSHNIIEQLHDSLPPNAKFKVIISMEQRLPRQIYEEEWTLLSSHRPAGSDSPPYLSRISKYRELGWVERVVPLVFVLLYIAELVRQAAS